MLVIATIIIFVLSLGQIDHSKEKTSNDDEKSSDPLNDQVSNSKFQSDLETENRRKEEVFRRNKRLVELKAELTELLSRKRKLGRMVDIGFFVARLLGVLALLGINALFFFLSGAESFNELLPFNGFLAIGATAVLFLFSKSMTTVRDSFRKLHDRISRYAFRKDQDLETHIDQLTMEKEEIEIFLVQNKSSKLEIA